MSRFTDAVFINPFTMRPMARTPGGSKWATVVEEPPVTPGPNRTVTVASKRAVPRSQVGSLHYSPYKEEISPRTIAGPSSRSEPQFGVNRIDDNPAPNVRPVSQESWEVFDVGIADHSTSHNARSDALRRPQSPVSPLESASSVRDRPVQMIETRRWPSPDSSLVSPSQPPETPWPRYSFARPKVTRKQAKKSAITEKSHNSQKDAHNAQVAVGRAGKIIRAIRHYKLRKKNERQRQRQQVQFTEPQSILHRNKATQRPLPSLLLDHLHNLASPTGDSASVHSSSKGEDERASEATHVSSSSAELPFLASESVQDDLVPHIQETVVDFANPLLPAPRLNPAPKPRKLDKELPMSPPPPVPPAKPPVSQNKHRPYPQTQKDTFATLGDVQAQKPNKKTATAKKPSGVGWIGRKGSKFFNELVDVLDTDKDQRKQRSIKDKISQPQPMMATDSRTVNVAKESGGVGGLAAAISLPVSNGIALRPKPRKDRNVIKKPPPRPERPGKTSIDDDPSQSYPVMNPYAQTQSQGRDHQQANGSPRAGYLSPAPLISTRPLQRSGNRHGHARGRANERNTKFYQPYDDVLQEYRD